MGALTRRAALAMLAGSAVSVLAACGSGSQTSAITTNVATSTTAVSATPAGATTGKGTTTTAATKPPSAGAQGGVTLQVFSFAKTRADWLVSVAKLKSQEQGTPLTLDAQVVGTTADVTNKLEAIIAGGATPPDLAEIEISQFPRWIKPGQAPPFTALDEALQGHQKDLFAPSAMDPWSWLGKTYGLGNELNASLLSTRTDLFKQAGLDPAKIVSWQDFLDVGQRIRTVAPSGMTYWGGGDFVFLAMQAGGGLFDQAGKPILNDPADLKALEFMQQAIVKDKVAIIDPGAAPHNALLVSGGVAALTGPAWKISGGVRQNAPHTAGNWHVQPLPTWGSQGAHASWSQGGTGVTAPATGKQIKAAVDFIIYAHTTTKAVLLDYEARNTYPTWRPAYDSSELKQPDQFFGGQVVGPVIAQAAADMATFYTSPIYPDINSLAGKTATAVFQGKQQPADALTAAQQQALGIAAALH
jgi:arabinosaccharide transport system substrate-binding protein